MMRIHFTVRGDVQGVGYRYYCQVQAVRLGLTGYARNMADGSVELEVQGSARAIQELEQLLYIGPRMAIIKAVERKKITISIPESSFEIR